MIKINDKVKFEDKWGNIEEGIIIDTNYQCDFEQQLWSRTWTLVQ